MKVTNVYRKDHLTPAQKAEACFQQMLGYRATTAFALRITQKGNPSNDEEDANGSPVLHSLTHIFASRPGMLAHAINVG